MPAAAVPVTLTAAERETLKKRECGARRRRTGTGCGRRSCWMRLAAGIMRGPLLAWGQREYGAQVAGPGSRTAG
jgi:hypothetical protein